MSNNICPVCGNQGIPAYHKENVICPRCGSDLSIYRILSDASDQNELSSASYKRYKRLAFILPIIVFILLFCPAYLCFKHQGNLKDTLLRNNNELVLLEDSINVLNEQLKSKEAELIAIKTVNVYIQYKVLHNDSPWKIVCKFYGIRSDWKEIAKKIAIDNQLWDEVNAEWKQIHPGQVIKIYNNK
jgi:uncharacterized membrane protein YvbJ